MGSITSFLRFYWDDLITDLRRPYSRLDLLNQCLRRVNLICVKVSHPPNVVYRYHIYRWQRWLHSGLTSITMIDEPRG